MAVYQATGQRDGRLPGSRPARWPSARHGTWPKTLGRDGARTPLPWVAGAPHAGFTEGEPWLPVDPEHVSLAIDRQQGNDSVLRFTSNALSVRKRISALLCGRMEFEPVARDDVLIVHRQLNDNRVTALFNFGDSPFQLPETVVSEGDLLLSSRPLKEGLLKAGQLPERAGVWIRTVE